MLQAATSLGRNGLQDWLLQRGTAIVLAFYVFFMFGFFVMNAPLDYTKWVAFFTNPIGKIIHFLVLLSLVIHAWIGFWTISTDYIKLADLRLSIQGIIFTGLSFSLLWGAVIIWSA